MTSLVVLGEHERLCVVCGKQFVQKYHRADRVQQTCSRACKAKVDFKNVEQGGSNNGNWKGGVSQYPYRYKLVQKQRYPVRVSARKAVYEAVKAGKILRPLNCSSCLQTCVPHAHHHDYGRPLDVQWLCRACHRKAHEATQ